MKPYVNQPVWYYLAEGDKSIEPIRIGLRQPFPGRVCFVWPDGKVNLALEDHHGNPHRRHEVRFIEPHETCDRDYCTRVVQE